MISKEQLIQIGHSLKPHGVKGEITIMLDISDIHSLSCIIMCIDGIFVPFFIENIRSRGKESILVKFLDINSDIEVNEFSGKEIYALKEDVPNYNDDSDSDIMYAEEFIGYSLYNANHIKVGEIIDFDDSTENALFIINKDNGEELLIPIVDEFIIDINTNKKKVVMNFPEELLSL